MNSSGALLYLETLDSISYSFPVHQAIAADTHVIWPFFSSCDEGLRSLQDAAGHRSLSDAALSLCLCFSLSEVI